MPDQDFSGFVNNPPIVYGLNDGDFVAANDGSFVDTIPASDLVAPVAVPILELVFTSTGDVWAADTQSGDWSNAANWTDGVPGPATDTIVGLASGVTVTVDAKAFADQLIEYGAGTLEIASGVTLTTYDDTYITNLTLDPGTAVDPTALNVTSGVLYIVGELVMNPDSFVQVTAGNLNIGSLGGSFALSASDGSFVSLGTDDGSVSIGSISGGLALTDTNGSNSDFAGTTIYAYGGSINIASVEGAVTLSATAGVDGAGQTLIYADQSVGIGSGDFSVNSVGSLSVLATGQSASSLIAAGANSALGGGNLTIGSIGGDFTVAASDGAAAFMQSNEGNAIVGDIGGNLSISDTDDQSGYYGLIAAYGGNVSIGNVAGNVTVLVDNDGLAAIQAFEAWTENPVDAVTIGDVGGDFSITAAGTGSIARIQADSGVTIGNIGGNLTLSATDGGDAYIGTNSSGNTTIGTIGGDLTISADGSSAVELYAFDDLTIGAVTGNVTISGGAEVEAQDGSITFGHVGGTFLNSGAILASEINIFGGGGETFVNDGTVSGTVMLLDANEDISADATQTNPIVLAGNGDMLTVAGTKDGATGQFVISETIADWVSGDDAVNLVGVITTTGEIVHLTGGGQLEISDNEGDTATLNLEGNAENAFFALTPYVVSGVTVGTTVNLIDTEWTGTDSTNWDDANNWTFDGQPAGAAPGASGEYVAIEASGIDEAPVVNLSGGDNETIAGLIVGIGAELDVLGALQVQDGAGAVVNAGTLVVDSGAILATAGDLSNEGVLDVNNAATFAIDGNLYNVGGTIAVVADYAGAIGTPPPVPGGAIIVNAIDSGDAALYVSGSLLSGDMVEFSVSAANGSPDALSQASVNAALNLTVGDLGEGLTVSAGNWSEAYLSAGEDLTVGNNGGDLTVTADTGSSAVLSTDSGNITFGNIAGDVLVSADGGTATIDADLSFNATLTIGSVGGDFTVTASNSGSAVAQAGGNIAIGPVAGDITVYADTSLAEIDAGGDLVVQSIGGNLNISATGYFNTGGDPAEVIANDSVIIGGIGQNLMVTATAGADAYLETYGSDVTIVAIGGSLIITGNNGEAYIESGNNLVIGAIDGSVLLNASDIGEAEIDSNGALTIGSIGGDLTITADATTPYGTGIFATDAMNFGAIGGAVSISANSELSDDNAGIGFASIGGAFTNAGEIYAAQTFSIEGPIDGTFINTATGFIDVGQIDLPASIGQTFLNEGTVEIFGPGTSTIDVPLTNAWTVEVQSATLDLDQPVNNASTLLSADGGTFLANSGGNLDFAATVTGGNLVIGGGTAEFQQAADDVAVRYAGDADALFQDIHDPNSYYGTAVYGINNAGDMVGVGLYDGDVFSTTSGVSFNYYNLSSLEASSVSASGIDDSGDIVGTYYNGGQHAYFMSAAGTITTIDPTTLDSNLTEAAAVGINDAGYVVGQYTTQSADAPDSSFLWNSNDGSYASIAVSGAAATLVQAINNNGDLAGQSMDSQGDVTYFVWSDYGQGSIENSKPAARFHHPGHQRSRRYRRLCQRHQQRQPGRYCRRLPRDRRHELHHRRARCRRHVFRRHQRPRADRRLLRLRRRGGSRLRHLDSGGCASGRHADSCRSHRIHRTGHRFHQRPGGDRFHPRALCLRRDVVELFGRHAHGDRGR